MVKISLSITILIFGYKNKINPFLVSWFSASEPWRKLISVLNQIFWICLSFQKSKSEILLTLRIICKVWNPMYLTLFKLGKTWLIQRLHFLVHLFNSCRHSVVTTYSLVLHELFFPLCRNENEYVHYVQV